MADYPGRVSHVTPPWVKPGAFFHIRIRLADNAEQSLINDHLGKALLASAAFYHLNARWHCRLFLLMPDHLHALLAFPPDKKMADVLGAWKRFQAKQHDITWQVNFFDHRIRTDKELEEKAAYIRRNPVAKNLCAQEKNWPWVISPEC